MKYLRTILLTCLLVAFAAPATHAVKIADITRLHGQRSNVLTGFGLIVGLRGTGDGGDYMPAIKPLAGMLSKLGDNTTVRELANAQNVALVTITAVIPPNGARNGDKLDVYVTSVGAAQTLKGGRLFLTPLQGPTPDSGIFAMAEGPVSIEDPTTPTHGVVKGGAVMEADWPMQVISNGRITLILEEPAASYTTASTIAKIINDAEGDGQTLAVALDSKNVDVTIPINERERPDSFISRVQRLPVPILPAEARVQINERTGTITITGDVEISPAIIIHKGLTITTVNPPPTPTPRTPVTTERQTVVMDPFNQGGAKLQELVAALDMIKVPAEEQITIIKELYKTGKLHAKLIFE